MPTATNGLYRMGGAAFIASAMLFLSRDLLELMAGPPPSSGAAILAWVQSSKLAISLVSETLFFASMALIPAVAALYDSLKDSGRVNAIIGCGIIAAGIPVIAMSLVVHGRLVYPIYGISAASPGAAEFAVAVFYAGMHAVGLMFGIATVLLSFAMLHGVYGKRIAYLGFVTGIFDIIGAYPDALGPALTFVCRVFFAAWFIALGVKLYRMQQPTGRYL
jgi:hypothetical protein